MITKALGIKLLNRVVFTFEDDKEKELKELGFIGYILYTQNKTLLGVGNNEDEV